MTGMRHLAGTISLANERIITAVLERLPHGPHAALRYEDAVDVPGLTALQARVALFGLAMAGRVRLWQEAAGLHLVARGGFRICEACGKVCAPGPCNGPTYRCTAQYDHRTGAHTRTPAPALVYVSDGPPGCGHDPAAPQERAA